MVAHQGARDKLAFLLTLVPYLVDRDRTTVAATAEHFGVSQNDVRQAVRLIAVSGIPGETDAYLPNDLFDIDWDAFADHDEIVITHRVVLDEPPRFSSREAAALLAGLQYLSALPTAADATVLDSVMAKLARSASAEPSQLAVRGDDGGKATLVALSTAIESEMQVEFDYRNARGSFERRRVDPLRLDSADSDWYLRAWDHRRGAVRTFRIDRMSEVVMLDAPVEHTSANVSVPDALFSPSESDARVTVRVDVQILPFLGDYLSNVSSPVPDVGTVDVELRLAYPELVKKLAAQYAGLLHVLHPRDLAQRVHEWAGEARRQYGLSTDDELLSD